VPTPVVAPLFEAGVVHEPARANPLTERCFLGRTRLSQATHADALVIVVLADSLQMRGAPTKSVKPMPL
jgi:hypothetical protein